MKKSILFFLVILINNAFALSDSEQYKLLNELAIKSNADKSSNYHNYTEIYARYFAPLKDKSIKFLEIGIWKGNSVKLWEDYFSIADLHFMDITLQNAEYHSKRSHYHIANQESPQDLQNFIANAGSEFDIIIDDGGHTMQQQIISFQYLFPHIKSGGMYIIEDLHTSYWHQYGGGDHRNTTIAYLKMLIDEVNYVGAHTARASHKNLDASVLANLNVYRETIESIHFYDSVAIIIKR